MIYMSGKDGSMKVIVLETANLEELRKGHPVKTPDGSVMIAWTPDLEWLARQIPATGGDGVAIGKLIDESSGRPEKPLRPYHEMKRIDLG